MGPMPSLASGNFFKTAAARRWESEWRTFSIWDIFVIKFYYFPINYWRRRASEIRKLLLSYFQAEEAKKRFHIFYYMPRFVPMPFFIFLIFEPNRKQFLNCRRSYLSGL